MDATDLNERMFKAVFHNDAAALSQAIYDGAQPDWRDTRGHTVLHDCVMLQRPELIALLVEKHGAHVDEPISKEDYDYRALETAVVMGAGAVVEALLTHGADIHATNANNHSAVDIAAQFLQVEIMELLLRHGASVETKAKTQPIVAAVKGKSMAMFELLVNNGASVNAKDRVRGTYSRGNRFASASPPSSHQNGFSLLHLAIQADAREIWRWLMDQELLLDETDSHGNTPLHVAAKADALAAATELVRRQASVHATNEDDRTPLHLAAQYNAHNVAQLLLNQDGVIIDQLDKYKDTPLAVAFKHRAPDTTRLLADNGASLVQLQLSFESPPDAEGLAFLTRCIPAFQPVTPSVAPAAAAGHGTSTTAASLVVVRPTPVVTYGTMTILGAKSLRSVFLMRTQSPFCTWVLLHGATVLVRDQTSCYAKGGDKAEWASESTVLARGQTSCHVKGGKRAEWASESFPLSTAALKGKGRHSVSLTECSLELRVRTPTAVPGVTKPIASATVWLSQLSTQQSPGTRAEHSVSLYHEGVGAGELMLELLY